jgi:3-phosphoshikimate 1-carboxyvinyltransferase
MFTKSISHFPDKRRRYVCPVDFLSILGYLLIAERFTCLEQPRIRKRDMNIIVQHTKELRGQLLIPGSKSHTIRALVIGALADGVSIIDNPLDSADTRAALNACENLGADIEISEDRWIITGFGGIPSRPKSGLIYLANSGTSLNLTCGVASLGNFEIILDGDESLRSRPVQPLLDALMQLGAEAVSMRGNGNPPVRIKGPIRGGKTTVNGISSQFVSSLLISTPLTKNDTEISVINLHESPYVEMTLKWLDCLGIKYEADPDFTRFYIPGKQRYRAFEKTIPADWSTATFPFVAAAITKSDVLIAGLDINDVQGDKRIIDYLKIMGAHISMENSGIRVIGDKLCGATIDLNFTPDALPALAVLGCAAEGETRLVNVAQARIKETDRIRVMAEELSKMGADIKELEDGLVVRKSALKGTLVDGHYDHRVVMALALAGLIAEGTTIVTTAESAGVTFPGFVQMMRTLGANITTEE